MVGGTNSGRPYNPEVNEYGLWIMMMTTSDDMENALRTYSIINYANSTIMVFGIPVSLLS